MKEWLLCSRREQDQERLISLCSIMVGLADRENSSGPSAILCTPYCCLKNLFAALLLLMNKMNTGEGERERERTLENEGNK